MANLSELVATIAEVEGIDPATVNLIARHLREAGLIAMHGRGLSAAQMGRTDAANLLIGVNATDGAVNAPRAVRAYRRLQTFEFLGPAYPGPRTSLGTLGDAIEQLLAGAARGKLPEPFMGQELDPDFQEVFGQGSVHVALRFRKSTLTASLRMTSLFGQDLTPEGIEEWASQVSPEIRLVFRSPSPRGPPKETKSRPGDRVEETMIGYPTLRAVGKLIG